MAKYRKKPVVIEPVQWFVKDADTHPGVYRLAENQFYVITIHKQPVFLSDGDWIVPEPRGDGKYYPINPDIFEATYEPVEDDDG